MKRTQNEKILQIKNETLVVGIDIGKETHYARAFDSPAALSWPSYYDLAIAPKAITPYEHGCNRQCSKKKKPMSS